MNTPSFDAFSAWYSTHKPILGLFGGVILIIVSASLTYFASAEELKKTHQMALDNLKTNKIQELRYHIDILSKIKREDRPPEIQRALDDYKAQKKNLIEDSNS